MKVLKIIISISLTLILIVFLNRSWNFGTPIPPLGKFLDPFHGFWQNAESSFNASEVLSIDGLKEEVTIVYDSLRIPHVFAKNDEDLYVAQGWVTARDRLWQMELQTHAAGGRLSEIVGNAALDFDRSQRRLGMVYAAERSLAALEADPLAKSVFDSFGKGVNAFIRSLRYEDFPIEYKLLGYSPEPWTNLKGALLQVTMAKTLNNGEHDLEMTNALALLGKETVDLLFPENEHPGDPVVDNPGNWKFKPITLDSIPLAVPPELVLRGPMETTSKDIGSNNWAVSGSKTATGSPLLCNDPHLSIGLPSLWYAIHLSAPGVNVMGASLPGGPTVIIGFNDSIAWGETNAQRDLVDWYKIQFKDESKNEYLSDGKWKPSRKVVEKIFIKGSEPFYDTVVYTHHGPIVFDERFHGNAGKKNYAYRWITHDPSVEVIPFYLLNRGKNYDDYMYAMDRASVPAQNYVFASVSGDIAMRIQGKFPVRRKDEGKYILDGTKTSTEWKAFIPNEQNISIKNPSRGFVSSANQFPVDDTYPYYIHSYNYEAYRNRRINKVLSDHSGITPKDMMTLQYDVYNLQAVESLPTLLKHLDTASLSPGQREAYQVLKAWDYNNTIDSEGASYYEAWWTQLEPMIWDEMKKEGVSLPVPTTYTTLRLIREKPDLSFFDIVSTPEKETAGDVIRKSFTESLTKIADWKFRHPEFPSIRWGDYKDTYIGHLLRIPAFSYHVQHGGNESIVNASTRTNGPSWRMVVSLEKSGVKAWGIYPGGQSGNPGSPYYNTFLDRWAKGEYFQLKFVKSPGEMSGAVLKTTVLKGIPGVR